MKLTQASAHASPNAETDFPLYEALLRTCSCRPFSDSALQRNGLTKIPERRLVYSANDIIRHGGHESYMDLVDGDTIEKLNVIGLFQDSDFKLEVEFL
jgi:hypothetical protein